MSNVVPLPSAAIDIPGATEEELGFFRSLSDEEQAAIMAAIPAMRRLGLKIRMQPSIADDAKMAATEIQEIAGSAPAEQLSLNVCPYPTDMCRTSMFFPMAKSAMKNREYIKDGMIITNTNWGRIEYIGEKLSIYDEDNLIALLALLDEERCKITEMHEGKPTYTYRGSMLKILKKTGAVKGNPGKNHYKRVYESFQRMQGGIITMTVNAGKTTRGDKKTKRHESVNMITRISWDEETGEIKITVNPYFYEIFSAKQYTLIDVEARAKLNSPTAKAIYRFLASHVDKSWMGDVWVLAASINVDISDAYEAKRTIKGAISELLDKGMLTQGSTLVNNHVTIALTGSKLTTVKRLKAKATAKATAVPRTRRKE